MRNGLLLAAIAVFSFSARADLFSVGEIQNFSLAVNYGLSPGLDLFNASGTYVLGVDSNGLLLSQDVVTVSLDDGKFVQTIPANSFVPITGGYKFTSTNPGIRVLRIMNDGTFAIQVREVDLTGVDSRALGMFALTVGDDNFSLTPNSLPVAKIIGPTAATVGNEVSLDGSTSTDFNTEDTLNFTWSLVSKPLGSAVVISSINTAQTSLIPDKNGYYTLKLSISDGSAEGIAALITIEATGGPSDPAPAPSPDNGFLILSADKPNYIVGESALLNVHLNVLPGNGTNEYFYRASIDGQPIALTQMSDTDLTYTTPAFTEAATHEFRLDLYIQNKNLAQQLENSLTFFTNEVERVGAALANETDPAIIAELEAEKASYLAQIAKVQEEIEKNRTQVGGSAVLSFAVNP